MPPGTTNNFGFDQIAQVAHQAGFRGQALQWMTAIAMRESGGNPGAYNPNIHTGDNSWGLWQINTLGANGPGIRNILQGLGYSGSFEDLRNPIINAQVAYKLSSGGTNFEPWRSHSPGWEGPQGWLTNATQYLPAAATAAVHAQMGQALGVTRSANLLGQSATVGNGGKMVDWLQQQIGKPYRFGSVGPDAFDCSGLVTAAYEQLGIKLPPLTFSQMNYGMQVDASNLQPGDLMFRHGSQGDFGHVGVYIGNGQVIAAPHTGAFVRVDNAADWIQASQSQGGTIRRIFDSSGRIITGAGLVPQSTGAAGTVTAAQAQSGAGSLGSILNPGTQGVTNTPPAAPAGPLDNFTLDRVNLGPAGFGKESTPDVQQESIPVSSGSPV